MQNKENAEEYRENYEEKEKEGECGEGNRYEYIKRGGSGSHSHEEEILEKEQKHRGEDWLKDGPHSPN